MKSRFATPQVHFIGEIKGGTGFEYSQLYCKWELKCGTEWRLLEGNDSGETFEEEIDPCISKYALWDHPFDTHYACRSVRGWPKLFVEVWGVEHDRDSLAGYGIATLPCHQGQYNLKVSCWRPIDSANEGHGTLLGIYPELELRDVLLSSSNRFGLETESTGEVKIDIGVMLKDFNLHGVKL